MVYRVGGVLMDDNQIRRVPRPEEIAPDRRAQMRMAGDDRDLPAELAEADPAKPPVTRDHFLRRLSRAVEDDRQYHRLVEELDELLKAAKP